MTPEDQNLHRVTDVGGEVRTTITPDKLEELERALQVKLDAEKRLRANLTSKNLAALGAADAQLGVLLDDNAEELVRGYREATRFYHADGTFEVLPLEEVTKRRKETARLAGERDRYRHALEAIAWGSHGGSENVRRVAEDAIWISREQTQAEVIDGTR